MIVLPISLVYIDNESLKSNKEQKKKKNSRHTAKLSASAYHSYLDVSTEFPSFHK